MALFPFGTIVNFFIHRFANLSAGEPAKACQTRISISTNSVMSGSLPESFPARV
jgi:hypothetical protein